MESNQASTLLNEESILELRQHVQFMQAENTRLGLRVEEGDDLTTSLRLTLLTKEDHIQHLESSLIISRQDKDMIGDSWERKRIEFEGGLGDKNRRIRDLELQVTSVKSLLNEAESANLLKDEVISSSLAKQSSAADEIRQLRLRFDGTSADVSSLTASNDSLRSQLKHCGDELDEQKKVYFDLKEFSNKESDRLQIVEDELRY